MRTLEVIATGLESLKIIYLQEFNGSGPNPVCSAVKNLRQRLFELWPKLRAVDGFRQAIPGFEPGPIDENVEKPEYACDEEWYNPDIYLTTVGKDLFLKTSQSSKEELDFKQLFKDSDVLLSRKTNVLTL